MLTHLPLDKLAAILQTLSNAFSWISLKSIPTGLIDNKWTLVRVIAWRRIGDKPFPETMLIQSTDAYMLHGGGGGGGGGGGVKYIMGIHYNAGGKWLNWDTEDHQGEMFQTVNNPAPYSQLRIFSLQGKAMAISPGH